MYDFLSFIDSKAIREYNKDRAFTPAEQAVIICQSFKKTLDEKLAALEYLYEKYSEEEFKEDSVGCHSNEREVPFRTKLGDYISEMKGSLHDRDLTDGYVYTAGYTEPGCYDFINKYFTNYQNAYGYLKELYTGNSYEPDRKFAYRISRIKLDDTDELNEDVIDYTFDNDLRLIFADKNSLPKDRKYFFDISMHFADIPLPFKRGELVKNINNVRRCEAYPYYVSTGRYNEPKITAQKLQHGARSDMYVVVYRFDHDKLHPNGGIYNDYIRIDPLALDYCDEQDIEHIDKGTKYLAAAMDEDCGYNMMHLLCDYGAERHNSWFNIDKYIKKKLCADGEKST